MVILISSGAFRRNWKSTYREVLGKWGLFLLVLPLCLFMGVLLIKLFYQPQPVISGWRFFGNNSERNQAGFRGQTIQYDSEDYVVVLLGDSQVEAKCNPFAEMPEVFLQNYLSLESGRSVKVFTLGAGGYGQDQQLLVLDEYFQRYRADLVALWATPDNDIWNNVFPTHYPNNGAPKPTFWIENGKLAGPTEQMGEAIGWGDTDRFEMFVNRFLHPYELPIDRDGAWEQHLPPAYYFEYSGTANLALQKTYDESTPAATIRRDNFVTEKNHYSLNFTPRSPRMQYAIDLMQLLLYEIQNRIVAPGGQLVIFYTTFVLPPAYPDDVYSLNGRYYQFSEAERQQKLTDMYAGFELYTIEVNHADPRCVNDGHLNRYGNEEVMRELAQQIAFHIPSLKQRP